MKIGHKRNYATRKEDGVIECEQAAMGFVSVSSLSPSSKRITVRVMIIDLIVGADIRKRQDSPQKADVVAEVIVGDRTGKIVFSARGGSNQVSMYMLVISQVQQIRSHYVESMRLSRLKTDVLK